MPESSLPFTKRPIGRGRSSAQATRDDLASLVRRAQDERFRLLKMLGETRHEVTQRSLEPQITVTQIPSRESAHEHTTQATRRDLEEQPITPVAANLLERLKTLDQAVQQKLDRVETLTGDKLDRLEQLDQRLAVRAEVLGQQLDAESHKALERFDGALSDRAQAWSNVLEQQFADAQARLNDLGSNLQESLQEPIETAASYIEQSRSEIEDHAAAAQQRTDDVHAAFMQKLEDQRLDHHRAMQQANQEAGENMHEHRRTLEAEFAAAERMMQQRVDQMLDQLQTHAMDLLGSVVDRVERLNHSQTEYVKDSQPSPKAA
jgi:hypothetical protein